MWYECVWRWFGVVWWRWGGGGGIFLKISVSENAFQAILKPFFPYSITSILSKVRHSNPRGGGTLIFSYVRRLGLIMGFKILNFNVFGGFQKNEYSFGYLFFHTIFQEGDIFSSTASLPYYVMYESFVDVYGVITKLGYI